MYLIRYQTDQGILAKQVMTSLDDAVSCWETLMADRTVRILPDPRTGLEISMPPDWKSDVLPKSWALMAV